MITTLPTRPLGRSGLPRKSVQELTEVSLVGHVVYGLTLGSATSWALGRGAPAGAA